MLSSWVYSISTQFTTGSFGRQISWLMLMVVALPPVFLIAYLPKNLADGNGMAKDDYEALPMVETTRASGDEGSEHEGYDRAEISKASGKDV